MRAVSSTLVLIAGFFGALATAQVAVPKEIPDESGFKISVAVDLVVLQATVRQRDGRPAETLGLQNFQVFEDGKPQGIRLFRHEDTPVTIGLVIDHSGSMREKLGDVTAAAKAFVQSSNAKDQMFVVNFNERVSFGLSKETIFSDNPDSLARAIGGVPAMGTTALYDAIIEALQRLRAGASDKKVLIVMSDGGDNASKVQLDGVLKMAGQLNAMIYTIGLFDSTDPDRNPRVLNRLARETGGEAYFPSRIQETLAICEQIARDIRDQYTLGYVSTNRASDGYRKIRLVAHQEGKEALKVRTRAGYSAGGTR